MRQLRSVQLFSLVCVLSFSSARAQTGSWSQVQLLPPGAPISVVQHRHRINCTLSMVTSEQIVCEPSGPGRFLVGPFYFARVHVDEVRLEKPAAAEGLGVLFGGGLGAGICAAVNPDCRALNGGASALFFGVIGGVVGHLHPLVHGSVVYRR